MAKGRKVSETVYEAAILLRDAPLHPLFAPADLAAAYKSAVDHEKKKNEAATRLQADAIRRGRLHEQSRSYVARDLKIDLPLLESDPEYLKYLPGDEEIATHNETHSSAISDEMCRRFETEIRELKYRAYGYCAGQLYPVEIPEGILHSATRIDFQRSIMRNGNIIFSAVHIAPPNASREQDTNSRSIAKTGRGSRLEDAKSAYFEIANTLSYEESLKSVWRKTFNHLVERTKNPRGLAYSTLLPLLRELHPAELENARRSSRN